MMLWLDSSPRDSNAPPVPFRVKLFGTLGFLLFVAVCANAITG